MGEVWPTAHITELCLQLTAGSRPVNGDEHRALRSQSCDRALLTTGDFTFTLAIASRTELLRAVTEEEMKMLKPADVEMLCRYDSE